MQPVLASCQTTYLVRRGTRSASLRVLVDRIVAISVGRVVVPLVAEGLTALYECHLYRAVLVARDARLFVVVSVLDHLCRNSTAPARHVGHFEALYLDLHRYGYRIRERAAVVVGDGQVVGTAAAQVRSVALVDGHCIAVGQGHCCSRLSRGHLSDARWARPSEGIRSSATERRLVCRVVRIGVVASVRSESLYLDQSVVGSVVAASHCRR